MREGMFIKKNVDKWNSYQRTSAKNPDETAERFVTLVDDLSYAKTFYPHSKVTRWINSIAAGVYLNIYQNRKGKYTRIFSFWKYELPLLFKQYQRILLFTFSVFVIFAGIGIFSSVKDETFIRGILGNEYVDMTEKNISDGDPFGVYKSDRPFYMFVRIAMNNISISFVMALGGLLGGAGTIYFMWKNGLMLGCFQYMFFAKGLGIKSIMVIWIHGTLEILALVIAATAGFVIANGILFPGTYRRFISFKRGMKDALKIMIALIPVFMVAAFFETYVTHLMSNTYDKESNVGIPVGVSGIILLLSLSFIIWYFIIYPILLHKRQLLQKANP